MACGVPVLAAHATSLPEVVGDAGVLFPPHDVVRLSDALYEVVTDRSRHDALGQRGLRRTATFSWRRTAEIQVEAFQFGLRRRRERGT
jgi:glycosyltransferase involved in cell wall biosynthesis